jgi:HEPN domain-containing protein
VEGIEEVIHESRRLNCFHCQQSGEKYLKALIQELGVFPPRTRNLDDSQEIRARLGLATS